MIVVYIASPYTLGDVCTNVKRQLDAADKLMDYGFCPIVPLLTHFQGITHPRPYEDWIKVGLALVEKSDMVLRLDGESKGADAEVALAQQLHKLVVYSIEELLNVCERSH